MRVSRGITNVLFNLLPDQTADFGGTIWKVDRWSEPRPIYVDLDSVRRELRRVVYPWTKAGTDRGLAAHLSGGGDIEIVTPSRGGVDTVRFPMIFRCTGCGRLARSRKNPCVCGAGDWRQWWFVAYHSCGLLEEPSLPSCREHKQVRVNQPISQDTRELLFTCPVCHAELRRGFAFIKCGCGGGNISYNVHRAAAVYQPRSAVIVNPPRPEDAEALRRSPDLVLDWAAGGCIARTPLDGTTTADSVAANLRGLGLSDDAIAAMLAAPGVDLPAQESSASSALHGEDHDRAAEDAINLAYAVAGGRRLLSDLGDGAAPAMKLRYEQKYPEVIGAAALAGVDHLERFPVLAAVYGFTRGDQAPGAASLRWFEDEGALRVHGYRTDTEALLFHLDPLMVASYLKRRGLLTIPYTDAASARIAILTGCELPEAGEAPASPTLGSALLELVHSYSHWVIRHVTAFAGIDRDSLSEYLVPRHLAFIVYAQTRGFVLGGLQALFEHDLDTALGAVLNAERRCALDPGCGVEGSACVACLHLGEPSCRYFNTFLSREALFGTDGYFTHIGA
jgi:hypothetical protein